MKTSPLTAMKPVTLVAAPALIAAAWPVLTWYASRVTDQSDEPLGVLALLTAFALLTTRLREPRFRAGMRVNPFALLCGAALLTALPHTPLGQFPLVLGLVAVATLGFSVSLPCGKAGLVALLVLSLPLVGSLDFYAGYPLRMVAAEIAVRLLQLGGLEVTRAGVMLMDGPNLVGMDPPCAGIRMLWTSCFVAAVMAARMHLRWSRTLLLLGGALATVVAGNSVRAALVFFPESGRVHWPEWMHPGAGLVVHGLVLAVIFRLAGFMEERTRHLRMESQAANSLCLGPWRTAALAGVVIVLSAAAFLIGDPRQDMAPLHGTDAPWPATLDGMPLSLVPLTSREERFARAFPGEIAKFRSHDSEVIFRRVASATRRMHPSGDCLRAAGFTITGKPVFQDVDGRLWGCSIAERNGQSWRVRERYMSAGQNRVCTDASAWFWQAVLHPADGPWLAITVMEPL